LHVAVKKGHAEVVPVLLRYGADVNARDNQNQTPLHHASELGYVEIAQLLLDHGADTSARNKDDNTPLYVAVAKGQRDIIQVYLDRGADVNFRERSNWASILSRTVSSAVQRARQTILAQSPETAVKGS
jgi:ankyrin repeat protein